MFGEVTVGERNRIRRNRNMIKAHVMCVLADEGKNDDGKGS